MLVQMFNYHDDLNNEIFNLCIIKSGFGWDGIQEIDAFNKLQDQNIELRGLDHLIEIDNIGMGW